MNATHPTHLCEEIDAEAQLVRAAHAQLDLACKRLSLLVEELGQVAANLDALRHRAADQETALQLRQDVIRRLKEHQQ